MATASFQYGSDDPIDFTIQNGESILDAWKRNALDAGGDPNRAVTFKAGGAVLNPSATPQPGQTIVATASLEQKG